MKLAPIVIFSYNRPKHLQRTLNALKLNKLSRESEIYLFSDGPKNKNKTELKRISSVQKIIKNLDGFKKKYFFFHKKNIGLKKNILDGVSQILKKKSNIIVLEDDIIVSKYFLEYMNTSLRLYEYKKKVWHISGWNYNLKINDIKLKDENTFFVKNMNCWGWATWSDRWKKIITDPNFFIKRFNNKNIYDFDLSNSLNNWSQLIRNKKKKLNTWGVFWNATIFYYRGVCLNPVKSLTKNIGFDGSGVNSLKQKIDKNKISNVASFIYEKKIKENLNVKKAIISTMLTKKRNEKLNNYMNKIFSYFRANR